MKTCIEFGKIVMSKNGLGFSRYVSIKETDSVSHELTKEVRGKRRSLGMWLYLRLKHGPAKIEGFNISIHTATAPYRYLATRTE